MKRIATYVLAALLAGAVGYFLGHREPAAVEVTQTLEDCRYDLKVEQDATDRIAREADTRCDARIDQSLAQRTPCP